MAADVGCASRYRLIIRYSRLFVWQHDSGLPWSAAKATSMLYIPRSALPGKILAVVVSVTAQSRFAGETSSGIAPDRSLRPPALRQTLHWCVR